MYDIDKAQQLQKQSHVRGALSKQFYSNQQSELERKRKQMKRILDEQVQQRKRVKQRQKQQLQMKQRKQEQEIRRYYENVQQRQRRTSQHSSLQQNNTTNRQNQSLMKSQNQSLVRKHVQQQQHLRQRVNSKTQIHQFDSGNYPLMPLMSLSEGQFNGSRAIHNNQNHIANSDRVSPHHYHNFQQNAGNIPLLDLSDENNFLKNKKKSKTQVKRQPSERQNNHLNNNQTNRNSIIKLQDSKYNSSNHNPQSPQNNQNILVLQNDQPSHSFKKKQRRRTLSNDQNSPINNPSHQYNLLNSRVSKGSKINQNINLSKSPAQSKRNTQMDIPQEIQEMENQNRQLKSQLKKSQQAISLLIGAVRSNPKLDKFRVQAEKILHHKTENYPKTSYLPQSKFTDKKEESPLMLPKIKVKHQSIMHDYLFEAAKKARIKQIKSQIAKY